MKQILTSLLLSLVSLCSAQIKTSSIPMNENGNKSFYFEDKQDIFQKTKLENLQTSLDTLHFRLSTENQAIDIWTNDYNVFYGSLTHFTFSYTLPKNKKSIQKQDRLFSIKSTIDTSTAKHIYNLFNEKSIFNLPSEEQINGWNLGTDGSVFAIEYSTKTNYSFKNYWTPSHYRNKLIEAMLIDDLTKEISNVLQIKQSFDNFINSLPLGCYQKGSMHIICRTKK
ncbi:MULTISPECIES: hypothetical protein [unclassified Arcicella]|uniref:hypothetical protein n=1 Tax=unclassified Arcicella TaxID=2644986 RepID=UPI0028584DC5|nr:MULTISPECIES: hypothetical protein [unclassified Arcicella]MDR6564378.1 hypothetical protein [Arcicella sp. BE51]MDR6814127.1 hypothetical protein [Arcicella sp. BE140]MDR6825439.1 hypothetical protein [Arcicella sp. BE139]